MNATHPITAARDAIQAKCALQPHVGVVLGSGLGAFASRLTGATTISYRDIPHFPSSSVPGHAGELVVGMLGQAPCAVMSGRVHYYEGYDIAAVTFPVRVLAALGVKKLLLTNAAGAVNPQYEPGDFMVIRDHLNLTGQNPLRGHNDDSLGPRFPDMSNAYAKRGQDLLQQAVREAGLAPRLGIYAGLAGPSYETPAEIRMLGTMGADAVGMSTVCEVIAAVHNGLSVAALSVITNRGAGLSSEPLSHDEVKEVGRKMQEPLCAVLAATVQRL
jgi:purine-nucleoside phosphorylase